MTQEHPLEIDRSTAPTFALPSSAAAPATTAVFSASTAPTGKARAFSKSPFDRGGLSVRTGKHYENKTKCPKGCRVLGEDKNGRF